jgi:NTE family protein
VRAFVLSGGGSLGAVQVGMLQALHAHNIKPDLLVGSSAGALNAAWVAERPGQLAGLAALWEGLHRSDVFPIGLQALIGALGLSDHLVSPSRFSELIHRHLVNDRIEESAIPLRIVTTDLLTGLETVLATGDLPTALLASAAIPGVFPPVRLPGLALVDGGIADNTPVSVAVHLGADEVWVLPAGYACALAHAPTTALGMALHALTLLINGRLRDDVLHHEQEADIRVLPPLCPLAVAPGDFSRAGELIERSRASTEAYLAAPPPPRSERHHYLDLHPAHAPASAR